MGKYLHESKNPMSIQVMIVDDNDLVREALQTWLMIAFPGCEFQDANCGEDAVTLARSNPPDLVLMDLGLPGMNGIEAIRQFKAHAPQIQIVMLSIHEDAQYVAEAIKAGASIYISKRRMHTELIPILYKLLFEPTMNLNIQGENT